MRLQVAAHARGQRAEADQRMQTPRLAQQPIEQNRGQHRQSQRHAGSDRERGRGHHGQLHAFDQAADDVAGVAADTALPEPAPGRAGGVAAASRISRRPGPTTNSPMTATAATARAVARRGSHAAMAVARPPDRR